MNFLSFDFAFKIRNLFILLLGERLDSNFFFFGDSFDYFFFVCLKNIFDLREVSFDYVSHSAKVLKQCGNFLLQGNAKDACDFRLYRPNDTLDFFLIGGFLSH